MTQAPYPPQYAPAPPVQYAPAPPVQYAQPAPQAYYPPQAPQAPQPPAVPLATGSIDDYYAQPSSGGGPSIGWSDAQGNQKPIGTYYEGIVARDVTNADIQQQTDYQTKAPKFYRDGRPMFAMKVPLRVDPNVFTEFPEGEASWYVKGLARDELVRAMSEAGAVGAPKAGAFIRVTLVQRKANKGLSPTNVFQVVYIPAQGEVQAVAASPAPVEVPQQQVAQPAAPVATVQAPVAQAAPATPTHVGQVIPPQAPAGMPPEQAALLAQLTGQTV